MKTCEIQSLLALKVSLETNYSVAIHSIKVDNTYIFLSYEFSIYMGLFPGRVHAWQILDIGYFYTGLKNFVKSLKHFYCGKVHIT